MTTRRTLLMSALATASVTALSACGASDDASSAGTAGTSTSAASYPITITHALGTTTIEKAPERIATVGWANHEVPLALGVVPVGMSKATFGDTDGDGMLPWVKSKLTELGAATPVLFDETDGIDYEAVADTEPDVILAAYSGLTQEEYDTLSKIAPVIAYPTVAWGTSVNDMIEMDSKALGLEKEGKALIEQLDADAQKALEANSVLKDKKVLFSYIDPTDLSQVGYYTAIDTRPGYLHGLGLPFPSIVEENKDSDQFYLTVSAEEAQKFDDVDLFITYGDETIIPLLQADPLLSKIPAIAEGRIAVLPDATPIAASANPSPLSIPWGLSDYLALLAAPLAP